MPKTVFLSILLMTGWASHTSLAEKIFFRPHERLQTRNDLDFWLRNMLVFHRYSWQEASQVTGFPIEKVKLEASKRGIDPHSKIPAISNRIRVLPYPGGRHPRIGFLEGAINPHRATKASLFLPWDEQDYIVIDLPEAIFSNLGLIFLAHTHIPTIWDEKQIVLEFNDWQREEDGVLIGSWALPNGIEFGSTIVPQQNDVNLDMWLKNGTDKTLTGLRTQVCIMLKGAREFNTQTNANKRFHSPVAAVHSAGNNRWIITAWERCGRTWGNQDVPCLHADPVFADCDPQQTVRVKGLIRFYQGSQIEQEIEKVSRVFSKGTK